MPALVAKSFIMACNRLKKKEILIARAQVRSGSKTPLAYEFDENEVLLLALGEHENFYRDLKRYLS